MAFATLLNNGIALGFTIVLTRVLGADGYGALAALVAAFLVLMVAGQAAQAMAAREAALESLGDLAATLRGWVRTVALLTLAAAVIGVLTRVPMAALLGVEDHAWGAAAILATGASWLLVCLQRGVLQGIGAYETVAWSIVVEPILRLVAALAFCAAALDVDGAFLGSIASLLLLAAWLDRRIHRLLPEPDPDAVLPPGRRLGALLGDNRLAIAGLLLLAALQNVDVIIARREFPDEDVAGSYAACAVAAKAVVWVAVGIGLAALPEATRRAAQGIDPRPVLVRAFAVLAAVALPALLLFGLAGEPLLRIAFGEDLAVASDALPVLALAMAVLAVAILAAALLVALGDVRHVPWLLLLVLAEPFVLSAGPDDPTKFAAVVLAFQAAAAIPLAALALRRRARWHAA